MDRRRKIEILVKNTRNGIHINRLRDQETQLGTRGTETRKGMRRGSKKKGMRFGGVGMRGFGSGEGLRWVVRGG